MSFCIYRINYYPCKQFKKKQKNFIQNCLSQYEIADHLQVERKGTICRNKSPRIKAMIKISDKIAFVCMKEIFYNIQ